MTGELKAAFEEMRRTELLLDDMDYAEESPRLQTAMRAAERFRELLDRHPGARVMPEPPQS